MASMIKKALDILKDCDLNICTDQIKGKGLYIGWYPEYSAGIIGERVSPFFKQEADLYYWVVNNESKLKDNPCRRYDGYYL